MPLLTLHPTGLWSSLGRSPELSTSPSFALRLPSKRQLQEASMGRRELG